MQNIKYTKEGDCLERGHSLGRREGRMGEVHRCEREEDIWWDKTDTENDQRGK